MTFRSTEALPFRRIKKDIDMSITRSTGNIRLPFSQSSVKKADSLPSLAQNGSTRSNSSKKSAGMSPLAMESSPLANEDSYAWNIVLVKLKVAFSYSKFDSFAQGVSSEIERDISHIYVRRAMSICFVLNGVLTYTLQYTFNEKRQKITWTSKLQTCTWNFYCTW